MWGCPFRGCSYPGVYRKELATAHIESDHIPILRRTESASASTAAVNLSDGHPEYPSIIGESTTSKPTGSGE